MTPEQQRIAIALACGWTKQSERDGSEVWWSGKYDDDLGIAIYPDKYGYNTIPDYLNDLNACHEAEKVLTEDQQDTYWCFLRHIVNAGLDDMQWCFNAVHSTAAQRCEAFLRTLNLWTP